MTTEIIERERKMLEALTAIYTSSTDAKAVAIAGSIVEEFGGANDPSNYQEPGYEVDAAGTYTGEPF